MDNDFLNQSTDRGFLHFWEGKRFEEFMLETGEEGASEMGEVPEG